MPVTGDLTKNKSVNVLASALPFVMVSTTDLADASNMLNQAYQSGKQAGAGFVGEDFVVYIASGDQPEDVWYSQLSASGNITPV